MPGPVPPYRLTVSPAGDTVVAHFPGLHASLTERVVGALAAAVGCLPGGARGRRLILEIGNVQFVSGAALQALARLDGALQEVGGELALRDRYGRVYEFFVARKLTEPGEPSPSARPAAVLDLPRAADPVILAADGDPAVRAWLRHGLSRHGFAVWPAATGWAALDLYRYDPGVVAAVLLAADLPGLDGPRALVALRRVNPAVRGAFLTGGAGPYPEEMLRGLGAAVLRKPLVLAEVAATLRRLLGRPGQVVEEGGSAMTEPHGIPAEAVSVLRHWCRHHQGLVAWCGARCEQPGAYPVDAFLILREADEELRGRLALDFHDYLGKLRVTAEARGIFPQVLLSREEYAEDLALLGIAEAEVQPVWPDPPA